MACLPKNLDAMVTPAQLAAIISVPRRAVWGLINNGRCPGAKRLSRKCATIHLRTFLEKSIKTKLP